MIGEGEQENVLLDRAKELEVSDNFKIIHPRDSLIDFYSRADLFVLPSIVMPDGITEGLGVPLLEAEASGLPVIASNVGGIPEAVVDGQTGFLIKPKDPEILAEKILQLLHDEGLRQKMGNMGVLRTKREFELSNQARILSNIYRGESIE